MALAKSSSNGVNIAVVMVMVMSSVCLVSISAHQYKLDIDSAAGRWTVMDDNVTVPEFDVGDSIVVQYDKTHHSLIEVSHEDYESCNVATPIAAYTSGSDTITFDRPGDQFYACGFPNHCQMGEKFMLSVINN